MVFEKPFPERGQIAENSYYDSDSKTLSLALMKWPEELRSYWFLDITNGHTIKIKANTAIERYYISPNEKNYLPFSRTSEGGK